MGLAIHLVALAVVWWLAARFATNPAPARDRLVVHRTMGTGWVGEATRSSTVAWQRNEPVVQALELRLPVRTSARFIIGSDGRLDAPESADAVSPDAGTPDAALLAQLRAAAGRCGFALEEAACDEPNCAWPFDGAMHPRATTRCCGR